MAERVETIKLTAVVTNYLAGMEKARQATAKMADDSAEKLAQQKEAFDVMGRAAAGVGTIAAAGVALAVAKFAEFDQAMSNVKAATQESTENMGLLREAALEAGADSVFSATEAANAIEELGKAGISTQDIIGGGLTSALDLASAGELGIARAAEVAAITMKQFKIEGEDSARVADVLAAGAGKALGSVDDLANGLKFVGPVAASMGVSLEETTGVLALFATQGIIGEQAGTSLRGMLSSLTSPSKQARKEMEALGVQLYDAEGKFLGLENAAGELQGAYTGMTDEARDASLGILFGNEQVTAARVLYQEGAEGVSDWRKQVTDSGYASQVAADRLDNLKGDVEALGGALDTALIESGSGANDVLRNLTQAATNAVDAYGQLPGPVQQANLGLGATVAAAGLVAGAVFTAIPKMSEFNRALKTMGPGAERAAKGAATLGKGLAFIAGLQAVAQVAGQISSAFDEAALGIEQTNDALKYGQLDKIFETTSNDVTDLESAVQLLAGDDLNSHVERFGSTLNGIFFGGTLPDQVQQTKERIGSLDQALAQMVGSGDIETAEHQFEQATAALEAQGISADKIKELFPQYKDAIAGAGDSNEVAAAKAEENAEAIAALEGAAADATGEVEKLGDMIRNFGTAEFDARAATREFESAIDDLEESIEKNGATLDVTTEAGRSNEAALDSIASSALEAAAAVYEQTGSEEEAAAVIQRGRDVLFEKLGVLGITGEAAEAYADKLGLIPSDIDTALRLTGVDEAAAALSELTRDRTVRVTAQYEGDPGNAYTFSPDNEDKANFARARGGILPGNPSATDNMTIRAASGEFVTNAAATTRNRGVLEHINAGGDIRDYAAFMPAPPAPVVVQGGSSSSSRSASYSITQLAADPSETRRQLERKERWDNR